MSKPVKKSATIEPVAKYEMPAVAIGDVVLWSHAPEDPSVHMALVTSVAIEVVNLAVLEPDAFNCRPIDGVHHADYPDQSRIVVAECGCWKHRPFTIEQAARLARIEEVLFPNEVRV